MDRPRAYIAIDLKSFYASAECIARGLDPMTTNLVVADPERTEKTICLAVTPALKALGIPGRARLFEVVQKVAEINALRRQKAPGRSFSGSSCDARALQNDPSLSLDYIVAPPQMQYYLETSAKIYGIYLKYIAPEDIHIYSIDEVFIDATPYLRTYRMTPRQLVQRLILDVQDTTGLTATAGIGTNLYLCKVALDILAKHAPPDDHGIRAAELDELRYRQQLWSHEPLTDFWRIGRGYARKLASHGIFTMGDVARCSLAGEQILYKMFGINAELLIDHAWGWEPCTLADIKAYRPSATSISSGQVLHRPYTHNEARLIVREMTDLLVLDLVQKGLVTDQLTLTVGYDIENLSDPVRRQSYTGPIVRDPYGRLIPGHAHGTANLEQKTASTSKITEAVLALFDRITDPCLLVRRFTLNACRVVPEAEAAASACQQLDFFTSLSRRLEEEAAREREKRRQQTELSIKRKFGKNAIFRGMNLKEGATTLDRNRQIGGHKA